MQINGAMLIGAGSVIGNDQPIYAKNPRTNETLEPVVMGGTFEHVDQAARLAGQAFDTFRNTTPEQRAQFLEACADEIMALGDTLLDRASQETGLPIARLTGERELKEGSLIAMNNGNDVPTNQLYLVWPKGIQKPNINFVRDYLITLFHAKNS